MYYIAQANFAQWNDEVSSDLMKDFTEQAFQIHQLAEKSNGFIWRFLDNEHQKLIDELFGIEKVVFNMTVWESIEDLKEFTFKDVHCEAMKKRRQWFKKLPGTTLALWWVKYDCMPSVNEAKYKLDLINDKGSSSDAFSFNTQFKAPND